MVYRTEYPRPQFERKDWECLNGEWDFELIPGFCEFPDWQSTEGISFSQKINVPFCPESSLSGIDYKYTDYIQQVYYRRSFTIEESRLSGRVVLHFGAVDYRCRIFINGKNAGSHRGGYTSFELDITGFVHAGENELIVLCWDNPHDFSIPSGKQCEIEHSNGCMYTRTTGIWQTVWLEYTPVKYIKCVKLTTDIHACTVTVNAEVSGKGDFTAEAFYEGKSVGKASTYTDGATACVTVALSEKHLWEPGHGRLYDLVYTFGDDSVKGYCGLRSVALDGYKFLFNSEPTLQRLVLDQGFYPDGIYTAPSDADLERDVDLAIACGFNGARLHQKFFEERYLYYCDKKGFMTWGEFPNWGMKTKTEACVGNTVTEWVEMIRRDMNHPCIVCWCIYNEVEKTTPLALDIFYDVTKAIDPTRPYIDISGFAHYKTDIYDIHDYEQDPKVFAEHYDPFGENGVDLYDHRGYTQTYTPGLPVMMSEYGGTKITEVGNSTDEGSPDGWGYGNDARNLDEFYARVEALTDVIIRNKNMFGYCYTQLYDIEQEQNGLFLYDRTPKYDVEKLHKIFSKTEKDV